VYAPSPHKKRLLAVLGKITATFETIEDEKTEAVTRSTRPAITSDVFQFKITLLDVKPPVWRRIQVPDCTLDVFHLYIQAAFGWWNSHLHQFEIGGVMYGPPEPGDMGFDLETEDETGVVLSELLPKSRTRVRWVYEYDFGDGWRHEVLFEGSPPFDAKLNYPLCVEGAMACPPEDVGGPWGYGDYLDAIADPKNERHNELLEWSGPFDPKAFDAAKATTEMRKMR